MDDIQAVLESTGVPVALMRFLKPTKPPFIVWFDKVNHYGADLRNFCKSRYVTIELYTFQLDLRIEKRIEQILDDMAVEYDKDRVWLHDQKMFETIYTFQKEEKLL